MTPFFLPSSPQGDAAVELGYQKLREEAEACTGSASRDRRIQEIECRRQGLDCLLRVGAPDAIDGRTVVTAAPLRKLTCQYVKQEAASASKA